MSCTRCNSPGAAPPTPVSATCATDAPTGCHHTCASHPDPSARVRHDHDHARRRPVHSVRCPVLVMRRTPMAQRPALLFELHRTTRRGGHSMTLPFAPAVDRCEHFPSSREGCEARQHFARGERCCRRCSHSEEDNDECPPNNALPGIVFPTDKPMATPGLGDHPPVVHDHH